MRKLNDGLGHFVCYELCVCVFVCEGGDAFGQDRTLENAPHARKLLASSIGEI